MDWEEKTKLQFASTLMDAISAYEVEKGSKLSHRQFALQSNLEYSHVQRITKGKVDLTLTTIVALAKGLEISPDLLMKFKLEELN